MLRLSRRLAVRDPEVPGRYLIGIECDGAAYHSASTARDRDRLRQTVLESLGWQLERVWSTDWRFTLTAALRNSCTLLTQQSSATARREQTAKPPAPPSFSTDVKSFGALASPAAPDTTANPQAPAESSLDTVPISESDAVLSPHPTNETQRYEYSQHSRMRRSAGSMCSIQRPADRSTAMLMIVNAESPLVEELPTSSVGRLVWGWSHHRTVPKSVLTNQGCRTHHPAAQTRKRHFLAT